MPVRLRPLASAPPPEPPEEGGAITRALRGLGKFGSYFVRTMTDPILSIASKKLPGVERLQNVVDAPRHDMNEPETLFGYELPVTKAQSRGFQAGLLDNLNYGAALPALSRGLRALSSVSSMAPSAAKVARAADVAGQGLDYTGIAAGGLDVGEGLAEGDVGQVARGVVTGGLSGVSRALANQKPDPAWGDFWNEHAQQAPARPAQTPLERIRDQQFHDLFDSETPISRSAIEAREAARPAPSFAPKKPRPGQATLQPADPVSVAPVSTSSTLPAAERARRVRLLNPRRQDAGVIPAARPGVEDVDDLTALDRYFETGSDPNVQPAAIENNASGDSAASIEALNRDTSMRAKGERFAVRKGGAVRPLLGPDAVDYRVGRGEEYGILHDDGSFDVLDRGPGASAAPVAPKAAAVDAPTEPDVFDLGALDDAGVTLPVTDAPPAAAPPPRRRAIDDLADEHIERAANRDADRAAMLADATEGDTAGPELQTLLERIAKAGGIGSMDDAVLKASRGSFRSQKRAGGELARVKQAGGGFGKFGTVRGVFTPGGQHHDVIATDFIRQYPEYAGKFSTGDEFLQYLDDLHTRATYRDAPPKRPVSDGRAKAGYVPSEAARAAREARLERKGVSKDPDADTFDIAALEPETPLAVDPDRRKILQSFAADGEPDLMEMIAGRRAAARPPVVDTLPTGEAQPRLPGDVGDVRAAEVATPPVAVAPEPEFRLATPPVKPPTQTALPASLPDDVPTQRAPLVDIDPLNRAYPDAGFPKLGSPLPPREAPAVPVADAQPPNRSVAAAIPRNVRDFLVRQLKYSPDDVAAMTPEQAIEIGRAKTPAPAAAKPAKPAPAAPIVQDTIPLSTRNVPIKGGNRPVGVRPVDATEGAPMAGGKSRIEADPAALKAAADKTPAPAPAAVQSAREKGTNPRAIEKANAAGQRFVETGDEASLDAWAAGVANEAQKAGEGAVKAGHKTSLDLPTKISANPMADPAMWKAVGKVLARTPAGRFYMGAVGGALVGHDQDDPWSETAKNAILGGLAASAINRTTAREVMTALERMRTGQGVMGERGVRPVMPDAGKQWSAWDYVRSPQRSIPDVMRKVQPQFEVAEQAIRGFDAEGKPIKDFKSKLTPEEQKLAVKESLKDVRKTLRDEGKRLWDAGEREKARLVREMLARIENRPTLVAQLFGGGPRARQLDSVLAKAQYFQSLAWNLGLGRILNPTQKYFALNYVPMSAILKAKKIAKTPEGRARTDFLHVERATDDPDSLDLTFMEQLSGDTLAQAKTLWERFMEKTGGNALRASDETNRRVVYLAASDYAKAKGGVQTAKGFDNSPEAIHRWAMDVVGQTQSVVGPMGQSPYVSRIGKSATTFTKFSTLALELAIDAVQNPRPETLGLVAVAASMAMANKALPDDYELDLVKMFAPRAMTSLPAAGQFRNFASQISNKTQSLGERVVRAATPDSPERYFDELFGEGGFLTEGLGPHRHENRYGSLDEHSGYDALARLLGVETKSNSERIVQSQRQRAFQKRTVEESADASRPARRKAKIDRMKRSKPGEAARDDIRRGVPKKSRDEYDDRFGRAQ